MPLIPKQHFQTKLFLFILIQFLQKIYRKRDNFDFDKIVNFSFLDGDVPRRLSYGVYISQLISSLEPKAHR